MPFKSFPDSPNTQEYDCVDFSKNKNRIYTTSIDNRNNLKWELPPIPKESLPSVEKIKDSYFLVKDQEDIAGPYDWIDSFSYGFAKARKGSQYYFLDANGKEKFWPYDWIDSFSYGLALVQENREYYFIDTNGKCQFWPYEEAYSFYEGIAEIKEGGKYHFIDTNGEPRFWPYNYWIIPSMDNIMNRKR